MASSGDVVTAGLAGVLPAAALYEILLWVPAKDLRRLRLLCRPWRSLLSDPRFLAAHAARHPAPLIVAGYPAGVRNLRFLFDIVDLSGRVVKRVRPTLGRDEQVMVEVVFDRVASTGEYKLLRIIYGFLFGRRDQQLFEVFTLDAGGSVGSHQWRKTKACPAPPVNLSSRAVLNGTVYFFSDEGLSLVQDDHDAASKRIVSFDFGIEEWTGTLREPPINHVSGGAGLAAMNGSLAVVHCVAASCSMDVWFLVDFEDSLWVKRHSIHLDLSADSRRRFSVIPLLVLNDGRILAYIGPQGFLRIYDPNTSAYTDVAEMGHRVGVGVYKGNLLSLAA
ncbi:hypothetical protein BS78_02G069600 [Paspalum vaginatum]|nr:hypothetical protein BS78_02G069600 [Paspalum vaginatum]